MNDATAVVTPAEPPPQLEKERQHRQPRRAITAIVYERSLTLARGGHVLRTREDVAHTRTAAVSTALTAPW